MISRQSASSELRNKIKAVVFADDEKSVPSISESKAFVLYTVISCWGKETVLGSGWSSHRIAVLIKGELLI